LKPSASTKLSFLLFYSLGQLSEIYTSQSFSIVCRYFGFTLSSIIIDYSVFNLYCINRSYCFKRLKYDTIINNRYNKSSSISSNRGIVGIPAVIYDTILWSKKFWSWVLNVICPRISFDELDLNVNYQKIRSEIYNSSPEKRGSIDWYFFSNNRNRTHTWENIDDLRSNIYPCYIGSVVHNICNKLSISQYIVNKSLLIPKYNNNYKGLGLHYDRFNNRPELVINFYLGDRRLLYVVSTDNKFNKKLECNEGYVRIFHPLFNVIFKHSKIKERDKRGLHLCFSIRESKISFRV